MNKTLKLRVSGKDCRGIDFTEEVTFRLIPPSDNDYYGNGHYMAVDMPRNHFYVDCRYAGTTDIEKLADIWVKNYFGPNAQEVRKIA